MGHTVWSQRIVLDTILHELQQYGRALRQDERIVYNNMLKLPLKHFGSISYANSFNAWAFLLLSIMLEQQKKMSEMEESYERLAHGRLPEGELDSPVGKDS
jgi:hypothetical protein